MRIFGEKFLERIWVLISDLVSYFPGALYLPSADFLRSLNFRWNILVEYLERNFWTSFYVSEV